MRTLLLILTTALTLGANAYAIAAQGSGGIRVQSLAEQEIEVKLANGKTEVKRQTVEKAVPGSEVIYTTHFTNEGAKAAGNIVITNPVPKNTFYVGGSSIGENTTITYSLDGKNFNTSDKLVVKTPDGRERPALPSDYTHIRWTYKGDLAAGKSGEVGFRVKIK